MVPLLIVLAVVAMALITGLLLRANHRRIRREIERLGGRVLSIRWSPFGRGWFLTPEGSMLYAVTYRDASGRLHEGTCRTDWLFGNRWTENRIVGEPGRDGLEPGQRRSWL